MISNKHRPPVTSWNEFASVWSIGSVFNKHVGYACVCRCPPSVNLCLCIRLIWIELSWASSTRVERLEQVCVSVCGSVHVTFDPHDFCARRYSQYETRYCFSSSHDNFGDKFNKKNDKQATESTGNDWDNNVSWAFQHCLLLCHHYQFILRFSRLSFVSLCNLDFKNGFRRRDHVVSDRGYD